MKFQIYSLGNPGPQYRYTRHNAGRLLCESFNFEGFNNEIKYKYKDKGVGEYCFEYIIPDVHMNESGKYILNDIKYKNVESKNIVIVYDDIDIELGDIKLSFDRNSGGHNGVQSVIDSLGTKEFYRVRVGIGAKSNKEMLLQDYVLSKLSELEINLITGEEAKIKLTKALTSLCDLSPR